MNDGQIALTLMGSGLIIYLGVLGLNKYLEWHEKTFVSRRDIPFNEPERELKKYEKQP